MQLDEALTSRDTINTELREILDDATDKWGVRVVRVEIQRIDPPPDVMHSMHEQMKAERTRRAVVTQADGEREAAITRAEGEQQAAILAAEGDKQQQILRAEGQAERHPAGGRGRALPPGGRGRRARPRPSRRSTAPSTTRRPDTDLLAIKYLEALAAMADGQATKIFLPTELAGIAGSLTARGRAARRRTAATGRRDPTAGGLGPRLRRRPGATADASAIRRGPRRPAGRARRPPTAAEPPGDAAPPPAIRRRPAARASATRQAG